jgi:nicotinamidase-related amidase
MSDRPEALLVVDMQKGFMRNGAETLIPSVTTLANGWAKDKVFYLAYRNHPDSLYTRHLDWHDFMTSTEAALVDGVHAPGVPVFNHYGYRPPDELIARLRHYPSVGICGVDTDACVMAAVFALWDAGIRPVVLADYCMSSGGASFHKAALDLMLRQFGTACVLRGAL